MATHVVTALQLNLRSTPTSSGSNKKAVLPQGTPVTKRADAGDGWWEVDAVLAGAVLNGFVKASYLGPATTNFPTSSTQQGGLPRADLGTSSDARRSKRGGWAYGIGEPGRPGKASTHTDGKAAGIRAVIDWLDVGKSSHLRWWPGSNVTYCNIYVYDVCTIAGGYIPRLWWTSSAIRDLALGRPVEAKYGVTVNEMAANYIFNWLEEFGEEFGWKRVFDLDTLQNDANAGRLGIICAQRTAMNRPGHIQIIPPEHGANVAKRDSAGKVTLPLQSQAGASNFKYGYLGQSKWWTSAQFREFGFWSADPG